MGDGLMANGISKLSFLKIISVAKTGGTLINYSSRFTLSGMTGVFPDNVKKGLEGISGTAGPKSENNIGAQPQNPAPGGAAPAADGPYSVPYTMQTGSTRYAPMQPQPGTKITKDKASMQFPTSSYDVAVTYLGPPKVYTTFTQSQTFKVQSIENTVGFAFWRLWRGMLIHDRPLLPPSQVMICKSS
jgi:hypothetical protein